MNTAPFKSWHALVAGVIVLAFVLWWASSSGRSETLQLSTGWGALALFVLVVAYVLRKYVHKLGISPEFRMRVPIDRLEQAESRLAAIRVRMASKRLTDRSQILQEAKSALRQEGVQRIVKVRLESDDAGELVLRALPTGPLGAMAHWMSAHLYYGVAAGVLVGIHGGLAFDSGMSVLLNGLAFLVVVTGLAGIGIWAYVPGVLTRAERDLSIEKAHALSESLDRKVMAAREEIDPSLRALFDDIERGAGDFGARAAAALRALPPETPDRDKAVDLMALLGQRHSVRHELRELARIKRTLNAWRTVHIPGAVILISIIGIHVVSVLWY